ncbi:MAG TPA: NEW3 domain-containing protein [Candidatus Binatia bacterium]|nr:NEW3 domain-containing protein [Candidatus Binatia bacterium]
MLSTSLAFAVALLPALVPAALAAEGLRLTTPYPAVSVTPGSDVSLDLTVDADEAARVSLRLSGVPDDWSAELRGGGYVIDAVEINGTDPVEIRLDIDVPSSATGSHRLTVTASATGTTVTLPIDITVRAGAGGSLELESESPSLEGSADETFTFNVTIRNDREEDVNFVSDASGPTPEWDIEARAASQGQATSGLVRAGSSATINVTVTPPEDTPAGTYPINLVVTAGDQTLEQALELVITGSYTLALSTPTGVLSTRGSAGAVTDQQWIVTNTGTAPITNVSLTTTPPADWTVTFEPETVEVINPGEEVTITAHITPTGDAIAGDYSMTFRAQSEEADDVSQTYRFTVEASIIGAIIGLGLLAAVIGGLYWVFRRYGRR